MDDEVIRRNDVSDDIGELCTIDDDLQITEYISGTDHTPELVSIKGEEPYFLEVGDTVECNPINVDPVETPSLLLNVVKNEDASAPKIPEDARPANKYLKRIPLGKSKPGNLRFRKGFVGSDVQVKALEELFKQTNYPDYVMKNELAVRTGINYKNVCSWFLNKRRRMSYESSKQKNLGSSKATESTPPSNSGSEGEGNELEGLKGPKRTRTRFSREQLAVLEKVFKQNSSPSLEVIEDVAARLGLSNVKRVKCWFSNRKQSARKIRSSRYQVHKSISETGGLRKVQASKSTEANKKSWKRLSNEQREILENVFKQADNPDQNVLKYLAEGLSLTLARVRNWFGAKRKEVKMTTVEERPLRSTRRSVRLDDSSGILPQARGSSSSTRVEMQSSPKTVMYSQNLTYQTSKGTRKGISSHPGTTGSMSQAHCPVCDCVRPNQNMRTTVCEPCHSFMGRYKRLSHSRRRLSVPSCSHMGTRVLVGCKGCRLYRFQKVSIKQRAQLKPAKDRPVVRKTSESNMENAPGENEQRRRSTRLQAGFDHINCPMDQEGNNGKGLQTATVDHQYPSELQKKILVTGKLNKLRRIATTLSNPEQMENKDRIVLSTELNGYVDDLLFLVLGIETPSSHTEGIDSSTKLPPPIKQSLHIPDNEASPSLAKRIQSLEEVVNGSITLIRGMEGQIHNSVRKETSTQTDAFLLFSTVNQRIHEIPSSLLDGKSVYTNSFEPVRNIGPLNIRHSLPALVPHCRVCDQPRPEVALDYNLICTHCQKFMENLETISRSNHSSFIPRCAHRGTRVTFGCKDCLVFRYITAMSGFVPNLNQRDFAGSQQEGLPLKNVPVPMNAARTPPRESHQSTSTRGLYPQNVMSSYLPLNYPQLEKVPPTISSIAQVNLIAEGGPASEPAPYSTSAKEVPKLPVGRKMMNCSVFGLNYSRMCCEACLSGKTCTNFE